jgi:hypothetical protein
VGKRNLACLPRLPGSPGLAVLRLRLPLPPSQSQRRRQRRTTSARRRQLEVVLAPLDPVKERVMDKK